VELHGLSIISLIPASHWSSDPPEIAILM